jgi:uncharacterized membrane protein
MNNAHLHLAVNHLPIVGIIIGLLVLLSGMLLKRPQVKATALGIFIFSSIATIAAYLTGEGAEEVVENIPGISETLIHTHEEYAELFFALTLILGAIAIVTLFLQLIKSKYSKHLYILVLILTIVISIVAKYVGTSGGEIRHVEIRGNSGIIQLEQGDDN